jgi:hypothetical protein
MTWKQHSWQGSHCVLYSPSPYLTHACEAALETFGVEQKPYSSSFKIKGNIHIEPNSKTNPMTDIWTRYS